MRRWVAPFGLLLVSLSTPAARGQTVTIDFQDGVSPSMTLPSGGTRTYAGTSDTIIKNGTTTLNFGQLDFLRVTTQDIGTVAETWTLVRWDLSAWIPPGAVVTAVTVTLDVDAADPGASNQLFELKRAWVEGDGTPGSGATWISYDGTNAWGTAGANNTATDRGATSLGTLPGSPAGARSVTLSAAGVAIVQGWVDDPAVNYGFVLRGTSTDSVNYASRQEATPARRPKLTVSFTPPTVADPSVTGVFRDGQAPYGGAGTYTSTRDTYIRTGNTGNQNDNHGDETQLQIDTDNSLRALVKWEDLGTFIPAGSTVTAASVYLRVDNGGNAHAAYPMIRAWDEGNGGTSNGATWNQARNGVAWGTAGASNTTTDRSATAAANVPTTAGNSDLNLTLPTSLVQGWVDTPTSNQGLIFVAGGADNVIYRARDHGTQSTRPALTITWIPPATGVLKQINGGADWNAPGSWSPAGLPGANDSVLILGPGTVTHPSGTHTVARVEARNGGGLSVSGGALTVTGLTWMTGDLTVGAGATYVGRGRLQVLHTGRLIVSGGTVRVGTGAANACWLGGSLTGGGNGVLEGETGPAALQVRGGAQLNGFTVRRGDADGLHVYPTATLERLRATRFEVHASGGRYLTVEQPGPFSLSAPGCFFDTIASGNNVRLIDTFPGTVEDVVLNLEDRGAATNGAGVGAARESEQGGASINWVHAAPDTTAGTAVGFPQTAWDLDTFAEYATYVAFRDVNAALEDRVQVFAPDGSGTDRGYWFAIPQGQGDIVGYPWWDQIAGQRVVWVATSTGRLYRFNDPGSGSGPIAAASGFPITLSNTVFTTPPLTTDSTRVYLAGTRNGGNRVFAFVAATGALAWELSTGLPDPVTSELGSESIFGTTKLFMGGGAALVGGGSPILSATFNGSASPFLFQDDAFRGTSGSGIYASGFWANNAGNPGGGLRVLLGPQAPNTSTQILINLSGAYYVDFNVGGTASTPIRFDLSYRMIASSEFEPDEFQDLLVSVDGTLVGAGANDYVARLVGDENGGPNMDTGWRTFSFVRQLAPGTHRLRLGGYMNKSTQPEEVVECFFDNVTIQTSPTQGRIYRVNALTAAVELQDQTPFAPVVAAPFPAFQTGLFVGDSSGTVHGVEHTTTMVPLGGWPLQGGTNPVQGSVWLDYTSQQVFWGDEGGAVHARTVAGGTLAGFPITGALGDGAGIRHATSDSGLLWVSSQRGRLRKFTIASGAASGTLYRFGYGNPVSAISFAGFSVAGWQVSAGDKFLVVDP